MSLIKSTLALLILLLACGSPMRTQTLSIELDKTSYVEGESVCLVISLENNTSQNIFYNDFSLETHEIQLTVFRPDGKKVPYMGATNNTINPIQHTLLPNGKVSTGVDIDGYFPTFTDSHYMYRKLLPGKYTVQAQFAFGKSYIQSNELKFEVESPTGKVKEALTELERVYVWENYFSLDSAKVLRVYENYVNKHGDSPYAPVILNEIAWTYRKAKDSSRALEAYRKLVSEYPSHGLALVALQSEYLPPTLKQILVKEIMSKQPTSRSAKTVPNLHGVKELNPNGR